MNWNITESLEPPLAPEYASEQADQKWNTPICVWSNIWGIFVLLSLKACLFLVRAICNPDKKNILCGKNSVQKRLKPVNIA